MTEAPLPSAVEDTPLLRYLQACHARFAPNHEGAVADYIPELGKAPPDAFGIALATIDGHLYEVGDTAAPFTIQSVSKPFVFALALDTLGAETVEAAIGVEPSGEAFNSIRLRPDNRPFNPMVNTGAIACTSLIANADGPAAFDRILAQLGRFAGRPLGVDEAVFRSERSTGDRNRAIAYLLRNMSGIKGDVDTLLDVYFRQCSVLVTARDLAVMGATLANHGVNPLTGEAVASPYAIARTLAVMSTAGMYDFAGEWIYRVGVPAKSGVGGGIVAALPSQLGLGTFSPRLDSHGNSVRGVCTCEAISETFDLHMLSRNDEVRGCVVADYDLRTVPARPGREAKQHRILEERSSAIRVLELAGKLSFATVDYLSRRVMGIAAPEYLILNLHRVTTLTDAGERLLSELLQDVLPAGTTVVLAGIDPTTSAWPKIRALRTSSGRVRIFPTFDAAVEWAEDQLVYRHGELAPVETEADLARQTLLAGLSAEELAEVARRGKRVEFDGGVRVLEASEPARKLYFLLRGLASARSLRGDRIATMLPGMAFGELALIDQTRNTDVWSETPVVCLELTSEQFAAFEASHPRAAHQVIRNLAVLTAARLRMAMARLDMLNG